MCRRFVGEPSPSTRRVYPETIEHRREVDGVLVANDRLDEVSDERFHQATASVRALAIRLLAVSEGWAPMDSQ